MGLVLNLKKTLKNLAETILAELSCLYMRHRVRQTSKRRGSYLSTGSLPSRLTRVDLPTIIVTSSAGTSAKTIMKDSTKQALNHVRDWVIDLIEDYDKNKPVDRMYDKLAIIDEWYECLNPEIDDEVIILDKISEEEYNDYVDYMNDGLERS